MKEKTGPDYESAALPAELGWPLNQQLTDETAKFERLTAQFLQERKYLQNVSPKTLYTYGCAFKAFGPVNTRQTIMERITELRQRGLSAISVNCYLRHMRAFWKWQGLELKIPKLREEQKILETLNQGHLLSLIQFRPTGTNIRRAWLVALTILSTGLRISETLGLRREDCDLDGMTFKVLGKGGKERVVPFCAELRKRLYREVLKHENHSYIFGTKVGTRVSVRNFERDLKHLGEVIGIGHLAPHQLRHTFACEYLKRGGNLEFLRRILGHNSLSTTQKYLKSLGVEDLGLVHNQLSPLSRR